MTRLMNLYTPVPLYTTPQRQPVMKYVPSWIKLQLRHHMGKKIVALEAEILGQIDRLIGGPEGLGRRQPIAICVCLWILILAYRSHIDFIFFYFREDDDCKSSQLAKLGIKKAEKELI